MGKRVKIAGNIAKKIRESKGLSMDAVIAEAKEKGVNFSQSTLQRIEKNDNKKTWNIEHAHFLADFYDIPHALILPDEGIPTQLTVPLSVVETGAQFVEILDSSEGFYFEIDGEPDEAHIRNLILKLHDFLSEHYGSSRKWHGAYNPNKLIQKTRREYELRDFIDELNLSKYSLFIHNFFRYEAFIDPDEDGVTWMGIQTKDNLKKLANPQEFDPYYEGDDSQYHPIEPDGEAFRVIAQITIKKCDDQILKWTVDTDPGQITSKDIWKNKTLREYVLSGETVTMNHEEFLTAVNEEISNPFAKELNALGDTIK